MKPVTLLIALLCWVGPAEAQVAPLRDTLPLRPVFRLIDQFAERAMRRGRTPGMALALVDRSGLITVRSYGWAVLETRRPITSETRFEIGSISKSFTAIALLQLQDSGRFDPRRPVRNYLPWFTPTTRWRPITSHDLLTHTAGLPSDRDDVPSSRAQAILVRERTVGSAPGTRFAYSNIGYQVLGVLLEQLTGQRYPEVIESRILRPLGLSHSSASFTDRSRVGMAHGYVSLADDRPGRQDDPLVPAPWVEYASGDGSIVATVPDLGRYLMMLLNEGVGPDGRLLSPGAFRLMMSRQAATDEDGAGYGYGMFLDSLDHHPVFRHSGGMIGYSSILIGMPDLGIGAVAMINGPGDPESTAAFALRALAHALRGEEPVELPEEVAPEIIQGAGRFAGTFRGDRSDSLVFVAEGDSLYLLRPGRKLLLERYGEDAFLVPDTAFSVFPIRFSGDSLGMTEAWYGGAWYTSARYRGPKTFVVPPGWRAYPGHYRIMQPWEPNLRVVLREGALWVIQPDGDEQSLVPTGNGAFLVGGPGSAEVLRFGEVVDGRAETVNWSGMTYFRYFTP